LLRKLAAPGVSNQGEPKPLEGVESAASEKTALADD